MKKPSAGIASQVELKTIQPISATERQGKISDLFTIWFGSNIMMLSVITGSLAVCMFNLSFFTATAAVIVGNLAGAVFMALHSAQGSQLGVPQMIQTRGQFGSYGALLVVTLVVIMYLGFFASNLVLGGQGLHAICPPLSINSGIAIVGVLSVTATAFGYNLIHTYTRIMSWLSGSALLLSFAWILLVNGLPETFFIHRPPTFAGFFGTMSIAALWQLAYAPYVSDYSRYMPENSHPRKVFWASYWGCSLGSIFPMILGVVIALCWNDSDIVTGLVTLTGGASTLIVVIFSVGIAATNAMNLYCGTLCALTVGQTLAPSWSPRSGARIILALGMFTLSLVLAVKGQGNFLVNYTHFILLLLYVLIPWTAINLVDYYLIAHGNYHVPSFFRQDGGIYGYFNLRAMACYLLGILVQIPFIATDLYTGCIARAMGGADISWIVGLAVVCPAYYLMSKGIRASAHSPA
ncbi:cytosine permease [Sodalis sp. dw_96]|uniref:purine-cytosine permease family protein n=1 Tax=Sodalis sp. dw_96 TaxID=2719794 RepID=UPI001BD3EE93|nr:cytosine permease [Sodalis sp. dw_96]